MAEGRRLGAGIIDDRHELAPVHAARRVDLLDGQQRPLELRVLDDRHEAGMREQDSDAPGLGGSRCEDVGMIIVPAILPPRGQVTRPPTERGASQQDGMHAHP